MLDNITNQADLNIFPLGSYDVLIGMDWLEKHQANLDCYNKALEYTDGEGRPQIVKGVQKQISVRRIIAL